LIELLVVIAIIAALVSVLMPVIGMVRDSARRTKTQALINGLSAAVEVYALEDQRRRYPPAESDQSLRTGGGTGGPVRTLDLLRECGSGWTGSDIDGPTDPGLGGRLVDGWRRAIRYTLDDNMDGIIAADRPAPQAVDWNPQGREPFVYIWSLGRPSGNDIVDGDPSNYTRWLYRGAER
jgi:type II secretory pathway pseudopilin PulG